jgi:hypothetical protein
MASERAASPWRGYIVQITYGTKLHSPADDSLVSRLADEIVRQRYFNDPVEDYYRAVVEGLRSGESLRFDDTQNEAVVRDLLERLIPALDERKPWPEPRFRSLPIEEWSTLQDAPVLGRIPMHVMAVQAHLHRIFSERGPDGPDSQVLVLRLRTGQKVGLRTGSSDSRDVELCSVDDPATTRAAFHELTGLDVQPAES